MMRFLLLLFFSFSTIAGVGNWSIEEKANRFFIKSDKATYAIDRINVKPRITDTKNFGSRFEVVVYFSGSYGTTVMINEFSGLIYDKQKNKFLGSFPYKYEPMNPNDDAGTQPEWKFDGDVLSIKDKELGIDVSFRTVDKP